MERVLVVGGSSGIGKSIVIQLLKKGTTSIIVVDRTPIKNDDLPDYLQHLFESRVIYVYCDLNNCDFEVFNAFDNIDGLFITAGFGRLKRFEYLNQCEINNLVKCNLLAPIQIIKHFYYLINSKNSFYCAVMVSIAGHIVSPFYSVYGSAKAGLSMFIENVNVELAAQNINNRILDCSPGHIEGTSFENDIDDYSKTQELSLEIINNALEKKTLFIPQYNEVYKDVILRYKTNPNSFGIESYKFKESSDRVNNASQCVIGYLSGTFDLFHIGHLNLLRNAKKHCDYLIVGIHKSGAWKGKETFISFEERKEIVAACKYVDKATESCLEDSDAWNRWHYDKLIVGSDYYGSERFIKYESFFQDKNVEIIYLPYTKTTSSTKLRCVIDEMINNTEQG